MSTEVMPEASAVGECSTGEDVDFTADDTESKNWDDDVPFDQTPLQQSHEEVKNEDIATAGTEAGAVEEKQHREITEASEDVEEELTDAQPEESNAVEKSEPSYTCSMCQETFKETEEEHLKGRKHVKLMERLEKYGSLEAIAAEFQPSTCHLCSVSSVSKTQMQMHLSGNKHKARCASLNLDPSAMDFLGQNRKSQTSAVADAAKTPGPPDSNSIPSERPGCDVCNITLSSVHQLMQHLAGKRHKELVAGLKMAAMRLPPNLRPPQLRVLPRKNDGKPPSSPTMKPAPVPKPAVAVQGHPVQAAKRSGSPADGPTAGPAKKLKADSNPVESSAVPKAPDGKPAARKIFSCDICNVKLNSEFQKNEHLKGKVHKDRLADLKTAVPMEQKGSLLGNKPQGAPLKKQGSVPKMKSQQQQKLNASGSFWCDVCKVKLNSKLHFEQHLRSSRHCENIARPVGSGAAPFTRVGRKIAGGAQQHVPNRQGFASRESPNWAGPPSPNNVNSHFRTAAPPTQHQSSLWHNPPVQSQWGSPVLPTPSFSHLRPSEKTLSNNFGGLLDPPVQVKMEQGAYGLGSPQQFSKLQLDLALEISKLSQHLARPEFSQELSQQLSHHLSQELSRQRQIVTDRDRSTREDFGTERLPLLGDGLRFRDGVPLLDKAPLFHDKTPLLRDEGPLLRDNTPLLHDEGPLIRDKAALLRDKGPLIRDPFEDHAPRRPPLLGESGSPFSSREPDYSFERRDDFDRRLGIDSYGERRSHDFIDNYNQDHSSNLSYDDLLFRGSADFQRKPRSSGGLLDKPPLLDSHSRF